MLSVKHSYIHPIWFYDHAHGTMIMHVLYFTPTQSKDKWGLVKKWKRKDNQLTGLISGCCAPLSQFFGWPWFDDICMHQLKSQQWSQICGGRDTFLTVIKADMIGMLTSMHFEINCTGDFMWYHLLRATLLRIPWDQTQY